jgi:hypothetical protein
MGIRWLRRFILITRSIGRDMSEAIEKPITAAELMQHNTKASIILGDTYSRLQAALLEPLIENSLNIIIGKNK